LKYTRYDRFVLFEFDRPSQHPWALVVFDDLWENACSMYEAVGYPFSQEKLSAWQATFCHDPDSQSGVAMGFLVKHAANLQNLRYLVVSDFPSTSGEWPQSLNMLFGILGDECSKAFLIDLTIAGSTRVIEQECLHALEERGIPHSVCGFFTQGAMVINTDYIAEMPKILKGTLDPHQGDGGVALTAWWNRMQGGIDFVTFRRVTKKIDAWHHPSTAMPYFETAPFRAFLDELAQRDPFGVWNWARGSIVDILHQPIEKQYAYLCGKAFSNAGAFGQGDPVPFTAIRGLCFGLAPKQSGTTASNVCDEMIDNFKTQISKKPVLIDHTNILGSYQIGAKSFVQFARALQRFLVALRDNPRGGCSFSRFRLCQDGNGILLAMDFNGELPKKVFDCYSDGSVSGAWVDIVECLSRDDRPRVTYPKDLSTSSGATSIGIHFQPE